MPRKRKRKLGPREKAAVLSDMSAAQIVRAKSDDERERAEGKALNLRMQSLEQSLKGDRSKAAAADTARQMKGQSEKATVLGGGLWNLENGYHGSLEEYAIFEGRKLGTMSDLELQYIHAAKAIARRKLSIAPKDVRDRGEGYLKKADHLFRAAHDRALSQSGGKSITQGEFARYIHNQKPVGASGNPIDPAIAAMWLRFVLADNEQGTGGTTWEIPFSGGKKIPTGTSKSPLSVPGMGGVTDSKRYLAKTGRNLRAEAGQREPVTERLMQGWFGAGPLAHPARPPRNRWDAFIPPQQFPRGRGGVTGKAYPELNPAENPAMLRKLRLDNLPPGMDPEEFLRQYE